MDLHHLEFRTQGFAGVWHMDIIGLIELYALGDLAGSVKGILQQVALLKCRGCPSSLSSLGTQSLGPQNPP